MCLSNIKNIIKNSELFYINKPTFSTVSFEERYDFFRTDDYDYKKIIDIEDISNKEIIKYCKKVIFKNIKLDKDKILEDYKDEFSPGWIIDEFYPIMNAKDYQIFQYISMGRDIKNRKDRKAIRDFHLDEDFFCKNPKVGDLVIHYSEHVPNTDIDCWPEMVISKDYYKVVNREVYAIQCKYTDDLNLIFDYYEIINNKIKENDYKAGYYMIDEDKNLCLHYYGGER